MDNFKKYIRDNKEHLDMDIPDSRIWDAISQEVFPEKQAVVRSFQWKWIAAAACLLLIFGVSYWFLEKKETQTNVLAKVESKSDTTPLVTRSNDSEITKPKIVENELTSSPKNEEPLYASNNNKLDKKTNKAPKNVASQEYTIEDVQMAGFSKMVRYQKSFINTLPIYGEKASYFNAFKVQLNQMDEDEKGVRKDIKEHGLNSNQLDLLINIYQQKIDLLKQLNQEINRVNKSFYQNQLNSDSIGSTKPHYLNI